MLTNSDTGRLRCEDCGTDLDEDPGCVDRFGDVRCKRCSGRMDGYSEGSRDSNREFVERILVGALENGTTKEELADWTAAIIAGGQCHTWGGRS